MLVVELQRKSRAHVDREFKMLVHGHGQNLLKSWEVRYIFIIIIFFVNTLKCNDKHVRVLFPSGCYRPWVGMEKSFLQSLSGREFSLLLFL